VAGYKCELDGDADALVQHLDQAILRGSMSASLEEGTDQRLGDARMVVRAYERYSAFGGNRVSLTFGILEVDGRLAVSAVTTGGSAAVLWKLNRVGEDEFLRRGVDALARFSAT
jgi:Family of unknown function (DUF6054)